MAIVIHIQPFNDSNNPPLQFDPSLFQWLYSCVQQRKENRDLYTFVVQFTLDVILVNLHAVYENLSEVIYYKFMLFTPNELYLMIMYLQ